MGHERVGILPKSRTWREIVESLGSAASSAEEMANLAARTLNNVRSRFHLIHKDKGVQAAFEFLVALATFTTEERKGVAPSDIDLSRQPSTLELAQLLQQWVRDRSESLEYAALAEKAAIDTITQWTNDQRKQLGLFEAEKNTSTIWAAASSGSGFCEVARLFFAKFTERYLDYFIGREASGEVSTLSKRNNLARKLQDHVDDVSKHAFEISKITQSFAAGWFNKHARSKAPTAPEIESFLAIAFGKMREELLRDSLP